MYVYRPTVIAIEGVLLGAGAGADPSSPAACEEDE
jgi:hypothetical protein